MYKYLKNLVPIIFILQLTLPAISQEAVVVNTRYNEDNSVTFLYKKNVPGSYTVAVNFSVLRNASYMPRNYIIKQSSGNLFTLHPINKMRPTQYAYSYQYIEGALQPKKIEKDFAYLLPFRKGKAIKIYEQENALRVYLQKQDPKNWKCYLFRGEKLDSVFAIRKGLVINIENNTILDKKAEFSSKRNYIKIEHEDGSAAIYSGFSKGKIAVKKGQKVLPHTFLGSMHAKTFDEYNNLSILIFYLDKTGFKKGTLASLTYLVPFFKTKAGITQLKEEQDYVVEFSEEDITKEMSKRERKRYKRRR